MISNLQADFIGFAAGMPAVAISWHQILLDVSKLAETLQGVNPAQASPFMADIPLPVYSLRYSAFIERLIVSPTRNGANLEVRMTVNIHLPGRPSDVIRTYIIETNPSATLKIDLDEKSDEIYWVAEGMTLPQITPAWAPNADAVLATTAIPAPQRDKFLDEVERYIIWLTGPSFVKLVADILPRYKLSELTSWLRFLTPLKVSYQGSHLIVTSSKATLLLGDCSPQAVTIEPDPNFPYGEVIPPTTFAANDIDFAVYAPRTRLVEFYAKSIEPAVLVSDSGGGNIKWSLAGSVGLKSITIDLMTGPGTVGILAVQANIDFVGAARAWIDGPSGSRLSLASASVLGSGKMNADISISADVDKAVIEAELKITRSELTNVNWDINTPLGWPLDSIAGEILNHVSQQEVKKLNSQILKIGRWEILGLPINYLSTYKRFEVPEAHSEGLQNVCAFVAVKRKNVG